MFLTNERGEYDETLNIYDEAIIRRDILSPAIFKTALFAADKTGDSKKKLEIYDEAKKNDMLCTELYIYFMNFHNVREEYDKTLKLYDESKSKKILHPKIFKNAFFAASEKHDCDKSFEILEDTTNNKMVSTKYSLTVESTHHIGQSLKPSIGCKAVKCYYDWETGHSCLDCDDNSQETRTKSFFDLSKYRRAQKHGNKIGERTFADAIFAAYKLGQFREALEIYKQAKKSGVMIHYHDSEHAYEAAMFSAYATEDLHELAEVYIEAEKRNMIYHRVYIYLYLMFKYGREGNFDKTPQILKEASHTKSTFDVLDYDVFAKVNLELNLKFKKSNDQP